MDKINNREDYANGYADGYACATTPCKKYDSKSYTFGYLDGLMRYNIDLKAQYDTVLGELRTVILNLRLQTFISDKEDSNDQ